jgi:hypothetical protein
MLDFIQKNYMWIFSGVGTLILSYFFARKVICKKYIKQNMKVGNNSTSIQIGGSVKMDIQNEQTKSKNK